MADDEKKKRPGCFRQLLFGIIWLFLIAIAISNCAGPDAGTDDGASPTSPTQQESARPAEPVITMPSGRTIRRTEAEIECESAVRSQLRAPSTARFRGVFTPEYRPAVKIENSWYAVITVDAQNAFGAMIRSVFECVIDGDENTIRVVEVQR